MSTRRKHEWVIGSGDWRFKWYWLQPGEIFAENGYDLVIASEGYVVEDHADNVLGTFTTQEEAISWAKGKGYSPVVARVRHLNDKKKPDHWRAA